MDLKAFHGVAAGLHLAQFAQVLAMSATVLTDKTEFQVTNDYYDAFQDQWVQSKVGSRYNLGWVVSAFPALSAANHLWSLGDWDRYSDFVLRGYNPVRWLEYSASAGVMFYVIAQLSGVSNLGTLLTLGLGNVALQLQGWSIERGLGAIDLGTGTDLETFNLQQASGFILLLALWTPIFLSFFTALEDSDDVSEVPAFVYGVVFNLFFLFLVFGLVSMAYARGILGKKKRVRGETFSVQKMAIYDFRTTEKAYAVLSLLAKTSLTQLTVFGLLGMGG